jgi:hypothetical protein
MHSKDQLLFLFSLSACMPLHMYKHILPYTDGDDDDDGGNI